MKQKLFLMREKEEVYYFTNEKHTCSYCGEPLMQLGILCASFLRSGNTYTWYCGLHAPKEVPGIQGQRYRVVYTSTIPVGCLPFFVRYLDVISRDSSIFVYDTDKIIAPKVNDKTRLSGRGLILDESVKIGAVSYDGCESVPDPDGGRGVAQAFCLPDDRNPEKILADAAHGIPLLPHEDTTEGVRRIGYSREEGCGGSLGGLPPPSSNNKEYEVIYDEK